MKPQVNNFMHKFKGAMKRYLKVGSACDYNS